MAPRPSFKLAQRLTPAAVDQLIADYEAGKTTGEIVAQHRLGHGTVVRLLHEHGVGMRNQGLTPEQIEQAVQLYADGWSVARIGTLLDVDGTTAWTALKKAGVQMRPRRGGPKAAQR